MGLPKGEEWIVVARRRRPKPRAASSYKDIAAALPSSVSALKSLPTRAVFSHLHSEQQPFLSPAERLLKRFPSDEVSIDGCLMEDNCEEERRLLVKMKKAMEKVECSEFYRKFGDQLQSLKLLETLCGSSSVEMVEDNVTSSIEATRNKSSRREFPDSQGDLNHASGTDEIGVDLVVYGVGSILSSEVSRCQLSLALLLKKLLPAFTVKVYDPVLTSLERKVATSLGCSVLMNNEEGRRIVKVPTLFYMPHCEVFLYDNVLQANWMGNRLSSMAILGNSFEGYHETWMISPNSHIPRPNYVLKLQDHVEEHKVDACTFPLQSAFNDISWHLFPFKVIAG